MKNKKLAFGKVLLLFITIILFLTIAEILTRIFYDETKLMKSISRPEQSPTTFSENRKLVWELFPNEKASYHNSLGFRGLEIPKHSENVIMAIGDSTTYGSGIKFNETYPYFLEKITNYTVVNAGVPGYNIFQMEEMMRTKSMDLDTDLIIVGFSNNEFTSISNICLDFGDEKWLIINSLSNNKFFYSKFNIFFLEKNNFYRLLYNSIMSYHITHSDIDKPALEEQVKEAIIRIKDYTEDNEQELLFLLIIPIQENYDSNNTDPKYEDLVKFLEENKIEYVFPLEIYKEHNINLKITPNDTEHFNALGSRLIAEEVAKKISEMRVFE